MAAQRGIRSDEVAAIGVVDGDEEWPNSNVWPVRPSLRPEPGPAAFALHDAKNLMGVIAVNLEVLKSELGDPRLPDIARDALADIDESARRMRGLLHEALSGLQRRNTQPNTPDKLHVAPIVAAVVERMRPSARARGVRIVHSGSDTTWATIEADRLERVVVNLIDNAVRFSPPGHAVEIEYISRNGRMTLAVGDRGPGVPEGAREEIFHSYRRRSSLATDSNFGLGLAYCRRVARERGGDAWVFNRAEGGACFVFETA